MRRKAFVGATVGHLIEWYDYGIYAFLAVYIAANFFVKGDPTAALLNTFLLFAISFFIRPLGGLFFGPFADKHGRRKTLVVVIVMMTFATFGVGILPTAHQVGILATVLLVILRLGQGFSAGGEISSVTAFIAEFTRKGSRGYGIAYLSAVGASGIALGGIVTNGLTLWLGKETMMAWGWRIPFLIAGLLGIASLYIRLKLEDSPVFKALQHDEQVSKAPLKEIFRYPRQLLLMCGAVVLFCTSFYMVLAYFSTYMSTVLKLNPGTVFWYVMLATGISVVLMPISGIITDRYIWRRNYMLIMTVILPITTTWFFLTAPTVKPDHPEAILPSLLAVAVAYGMFAGIPFGLMSEILPAKIRSTGIGVVYNIMMAVFGGSGPFVATWLIATTKSVSAPMWMVIVSAVLSFIGLLFLRREDQLGLDEADEHVVNQAIGRTAV
jgi:MHS family proline/betaine transporter-like MFS transporter